MKCLIVSLFRLDGLWTSIAAPFAKDELVAASKGSVVITNRSLECPNKPFFKSKVGEPVSSALLEIRKHAQNAY